MADRGPPAPKPPTAHKSAKVAMPALQQPAPQAQQGWEVAQCTQQEPPPHPPAEVLN